MSEHRIHLDWTRGEAPGSAQALGLRDDLAAVFSGRTMAQWSEFFDTVDCCVTPVLRLEESFAHPLFAAEK